MTTFLRAIALPCLTFVLAFCQYPSFAQTVQDGLKLMSNEKYKGAVTALEAAAQANATDANAWYQLGNAYLAVGKTNEASSAYQKAIGANPKSYVAMAGAGKVLMAQGQTDAAKKAFDNVIKLSKSKDPAASQAVAEGYMTGEKANADAAIATIEKTIAAGKKNPSLLLTLGDAYLLKNDGGKAVTNYEYAADADKTSAVPHYKIGNVYRRARNLEEVAKAYKKAKEIDANFAPVYRVAGDFYYDLNDYAKAKDNYAKYLELGEPNITDQMQYANALFLAEDYKGTIEKVNQIVQIDSTKNYLLRLLGYCYYETGDSIKGLDFMDKFLKKTDPKKLIYSDYVYHAKLLAKNNKFDEALVSYNTAYAMADTTKDLKEEKKLDILSTAAKLCYDKDKYTDAIRLYKTRIAKQATPSSTDYYDLGKAQYFNKEYTAADSTFIKLIELKPTAPTGYLWRARTHKKIDPQMSTGSAKPHFEKLIEVATVDTKTADKYKKELIDAYTYLVQYYNQKQDLSNTRSNVQKLLALDPSNKYGNEVVKTVGQ